MGCTHKETVEEAVRILKDYGYLVKTEAWVSTILGYANKYLPEESLDKLYRDFKFNIANVFLGKNSPWIHLHNPQFQTRLDIVGLYYADLRDLPLRIFFNKKNDGEIALRTMLIEVEHRHSIEKALERIKGFPAGGKAIIWTEGEIGGTLEDIPVIIAKNDGFGCYIPELYQVLEEHINKIKRAHPSKI